MKDKKAKSTKPARVTPQGRPALPKISEEMKAWSAALGAEVMTWPQVSTRPMFGLTALYRGRKIFAVLPKSRGMESPNALAVKLGPTGARVLAYGRRDPRIGFTDAIKTRWLTFEVSSDSDLRGALEWLNRAYEAAS
jgi:hypothetical protein